MDSSTLVLVPKVSSLARGWSAEKMATLGALHAELEGRGELEPLLETLVAEPVYEFYPLRLRMSGGERVRRFYRQFCEKFLPLRADYALLESWVSETSVAQEYEIALRVNRGKSRAASQRRAKTSEIERFRVLGILYAEGDRLGGERVYASERFIRLMTGELFHELEPME